MRSLKSSSEWSVVNAERDNSDWRVEGIYSICVTEISTYISTPLWFVETERRVMEPCIERTCRVYYTTPSLGLLFSSPVAVGGLKLQLRALGQVCPTLPAIVFVVTVFLSQSLVLFFFIIFFLHYKLRTVFQLRVHHKGATTADPQSRNISEFPP